MTPFPISRLGHNNQALTKRFAYQGTRSDIWVLQKLKSQTTLKVCERGHDFLRWPHYRPSLWDALKACACPHKLTLLASSFGVKFPQPQSRSPILIWAYARKFYLSHATWQLYLPYTNFSSRDTISWKFIAFIPFATWCDTFYVTLCPTKRKVMSSSRPYTSLFCRSRVEFFYGFLGMFHVEFIHPRSLYWMVSFPLD